MKIVATFRTEDLAKDFIEHDSICNWCGGTFKKTNKADQRFCSERCRCAYDQMWEETKPLRYESWKRDYENWLRIRPIYSIHKELSQ